MARGAAQSGSGVPGFRNRFAVAPSGLRNDQLLKRPQLLLQRVAQPQTRAQEFLRVDRIALDPRLVMQMRSG